MEKQADEKHGIFDDDDLDTAIANVDDTGMVKSQQELLQVEETEDLPPPDEPQEPLP
jgi:hypothetical protein